MPLFGDSSLNCTYIVFALALLIYGRCPSINAGVYLFVHLMVNRFIVQIGLQNIVQALFVLKLFAPLALFGNQAHVVAFTGNCNN